ncbi:MAG: Rrf2 family transcriptional regulator [Leptothrix sp. (in: b-proteobacteria)]
MHMSTKGRYAVNALIDLALRAPAGPVALASIAQRQRVSLSYLEQLFSRLRRDGIVESTRGPGGGYTLGRSAAAISVADVVRAVDDPADDAPGAGPDPSAAMWRRLDGVMLGHMAGIGLDSLVLEQLAQGAVMSQPSAPQAPAPKPAAKKPRMLAPNSVFAFGRSFAR